MKVNEQQYNYIYWLFSSHRIRTKNNYFINAFFKMSLSRSRKVSTQLDWVDTVRYSLRRIFRIYTAATLHTIIYIDSKLCSNFSQSRSQKAELPIVRTSYLLLEQLFENYLKNLSTLSLHCFLDILIPVKERIILKIIVWSFKSIRWLFYSTKFKKVYMIVQKSYENIPSIMKILGNIKFLYCKLYVICDKIVS